jgi:hypothetical protein
MEGTKRSLQQRKMENTGRQKELNKTERNLNAFIWLPNPEKIKGCMNKRNART